MQLVFLRSNDDVVLDVFVQDVVLEVPTVLHRPCGEERKVSQYCLTIYSNSIFFGIINAKIENDK